MNTSECSTSCFPTSGSYWVLMTMEPVEGSRGVPYKEQCQLLQNQWMYPPTILEVATVCLSLYVTKRKTLFPSTGPLTYTRCAEDFHGKQVVVGNYGETKGLYVGLDVFDDNNPAIGIVGTSSNFAFMHAVVSMIFGGLTG